MVLAATSFRYLWKYSVPLHYIMRVSQCLLRTSANSGFKVTLLRCMMGHMVTWMNELWIFRCGPNFILNLAAARFLFQKIGTFTLNRRIINTPFSITSPFWIIRVILLSILSLPYICLENRFSVRLLQPMANFSCKVKKYFSSFFKSSSSIINSSKIKNFAEGVNFITILWKDVMPGWRNWLFLCIV